MRFSMKPYFIIMILILAEVLGIVILHCCLLKKCRESDLKKMQDFEISRKITEDMKCFPIPIAFREEVYFSDSYGDNRNEGLHEGCDIMDIKDFAGRIAVVSATDGTITNLGWLYLGGYRIGITSENNIYYYYAHLDSYAGNLEVGKEVKAGQLLGFMGDTGEGKEGTKGKFPVHLHFGIYIFSKNQNEETVNPYPFLQKFDEE